MIRHSSKIIQINQALDGTFKAELVTGDYLVILDNGQIGPGNSNLPAEVSIAPQKETVLNINIDTGIR